MTAGEAVLHEVFDLSAERVPALSVDDPVRPVLLRMMPNRAGHLRRRLPHEWPRTLRLVQEGGDA
jgi:hypothetical protein